MKTDIVLMWRPNSVKETTAYTVIRPEGHPSNRTILPKIRLTGQFDFQNCPPKRIRVYKANLILIDKSTFSSGPLRRIFRPQPISENNL